MGRWNRCRSRSQGHTVSLNRWCLALLTSTGSAGFVAVAFSLAVGAELLVAGTGGGEMTGLVASEAFPAVSTAVSTTTTVAVSGAC